MDPLDEDLLFWLQTTFQNKIQVSLQLSRSPAPEQTPYVHKYEAIQHLKQLLEINNPYHFIVHCALAEIYNDVEQTSDSVKGYEAALEALMTLDPGQVWKFYQYLIVVYNNLGLSHLNRDQNQLGLGCLAKAEEVFQAYKDVPGEDVYHNRAFQANGRPFRFMYQGGIDHEQVQDAYTLTLFYLAQAYTKFQLKDKAAQNCGLTLQRQHSTSKYELKEFVTNLIGLAEYYQGGKYYAQSQYILMLALKVIPQGHKKKTRATVQIAIGNLIGELLDFSCQRLVHGDIGETDNQIVSKQKMLFPEFDQAFPQVILPSDIDGCKSLFRQANTQFKKTLEVFVLDGYVTEHIEVLFSQSRLYKSLGYLQKSGERKASMLQKRRQILEPLLKQLNPKAYPGTWQKILVQTSQIINDLFTIKVTLLSSKGFPSEQKIKASHELGKKSIGYYKQIVQSLQDDKQTPRNQQYYRSIINSKINIAKAASRLMSSDRKVRVELMKQSLDLYKGIIDYVNSGVPEELRSAFDKEIELTKEMISMMPTKIDKVNYGQMSFVD